MSIEKGKFTSIPDTICFIADGERTIWPLRIAPPENPSYPEDALCKEIGTELFYPEKRETTIANMAKSACAMCPVQEPCLQAALERGEEHGIFGGTRPRTRRKLLAERRAS